MKVGDVDVMTVSEASARYGIARKTLLTQIRRAKLPATLSGHTYLVTSAAMEIYVHERKGRRGAASPDHPQNQRASAGADRPAHG